MIFTLKRCFLVTSPVPNHTTHRASTNHWADVETSGVERGGSVWRGRGAVVRAAWVIQWSIASDKDI